MSSAQVPVSYKADQRSCYRYMQTLLRFWLKRQARESNSNQHVRTGSHTDVAYMYCWICPLSVACRCAMLRNHAEACESHGACVLLVGQTAVCKLFAQNPEQGPAYSEIRFSLVNGAPCHPRFPGTHARTGAYHHSVIELAES